VSHRCGWWTEIGADGCYDALMKAILLGEEERNDMGKRGRVLVEAKYTWHPCRGVWQTFINGY